MADQQTAPGASIGRWHYEYVGDLSATPPERAVGLWCDACRVRWTGCQDAAECPRCGSTAAYEEYMAIPWLGDWTSDY